MTPRGRAARVLATGAALVGAAWALHPFASPPLYDGLQGPAEAYRYLNPPAGYQHTPAPTTGTGTIAVDNGISAAGFITTSEQPPQAQFLVGQGGLTAPAGAKSITVTVKPVAPPQPLPASIGRLDGNVYEVTATADAPGTVALKAGATTTVVLRGPPGGANPQIATFASGGSWKLLHTVPLGGQAPDMVASNVTALGFFAMTVAGGGSSSASSSSQSGGPPPSGGGFPVLAVVLPLVVLAVLAAVIVPVRISRRRAAGGGTRRGGGSRRRR